MPISINYDAILARIKEVSEIDTERISIVKRVAVEHPGGFDPVKKVPIGGKTEYQDVKNEVLASIDRISGDTYRFNASGRSMIGDLVITIHESELVAAGYDPYADDWYPLITHFEVGNKKYVLADGSSIVTQTLNGIVYEIVFHVVRDKS